MATSYDTHDNGGRTFRVRVTNQIDGTKHLEVRDIHKNPRRGKLLFQMDTTEIFIGKSVENAMTQFSGGFGPKFDGNSLLVKLEENNVYMHIGSSIIVFRTKSPIVEYESPVGDNDVPYPWALDRRGNCYLIIEKVIIRQYPRDNPYHYYYEQHNMSQMLTGGERAPAPLYNDIEALLVGKEKYSLTYTPDPKANYRRLMDWNVGNLAIEYVGGGIEPINEADYIELMESFGKLHKFEPMDIIEERTVS